MPSPPDPLPPPLPSPQPPRPVPARRPPPVPPPAGRSGDDEEAERLLTRANIQLRRGLTADAEAAVHSLLARRPQDAGAWELLADIRLSRNDLAGAREALQKALAAQPGRATAEVKMGRLALQLSERERLQTLGLAYAGGEASLMRFAGDGGARGASWAAVASALLPGLGQFVNGEAVKGVVVAAVYFLSLAVLALLPDTQTLLHTLAGALAPGHANSHRAAPPGGGTSVVSGFLLLLMTAAWLYGTVDAALAARRASAPAEDSRLHP